VTRQLPPAAPAKPGNRSAAPGAGVRGSDVFTVVGIEFQESVRGATKSVSVTPLGRCLECQVGLAGNVVALSLTGIGDGYVPMVVQEVGILWVM